MPYRTVHPAGAVTSRIIRVATGEEKADLVLKNARVVNVFTEEILSGDIALCGDKIAAIGTYAGKEEIDLKGQIVLPGLVDGHIHLESSLVSPASFARAVVPHGTTAVVTDPHEIANVCGLAGMDYMMAATRGLPMDVFFMVPSCVPALPFEEAGAVLTAEDIAPFLEEDKILGLAEMMNYPGVVSADPSVLEKIDAAKAKGKLVDGHAPGLSGAQLKAYVAAGIQSDHECDSLANALEKIRMGQVIMIRNGTAAKNLRELLPLLQGSYADRCIFCTDDKHPASLVHVGHIDAIIREAIALGAPPMAAIKAGTWNAAQYFRLHDRGAVAPGYLADLTVVDSIESMQVQRVYKNGRCVYDGKEVPFQTMPVDSSLRDIVTNTFALSPLTPEKLHCDGPMPLIGFVSGQIVTENKGTADQVDVARDILKMVVCERHHHTGHVAVCYATGSGLKRGALATSVAHDSHNMIAMGVSDEDIAAAVNALIELRGGMVVVEDGQVISALPLPIAGLMNDAPLEEVDALLEKTKAAASARGIQPGIDPFMTLSFMSLPVIPTLRLTTKGVFDVETQQFLSGIQP